MTECNFTNPTETIDSEGLRRHYNVIISGTGLVESIVAAALARVGCTVLHVDGADYYGQLDAVWTLPYVRGLAVAGENDSDVAAAATDKTLDCGADEVEDPSSSATIMRRQRLHPLGASQSLRVHSIVSGGSSWSSITIGTVVETPYGTGVVQALDAVVGDNENGNYYTLTIHLQHDVSRTARLSVGVSPAWVQRQQQDSVTEEFPTASGRTRLALDAELLYQHHRIRTLAAATAAKLLDGPEARSVALDITPLAVYAAGSAVNGLVASSVSEYVDFKSVEGLLYFNHANSTLQPVPCSKNDVFASRLLSPMDKRRLMKFLQTALDFATAEALQQEEDEQQDDDAATATEAGGDELLQTFNERHLNQGRSLSRPQNKAVANADLAELQALCAEDATSHLRDYLQQRLSPSLTPLVHYALALAHDDTTTTTDGIHELCHHMRALGRFGGTAFLVPMYGSGELAQAFCRSAAVFGATYLLRRAATSIVLQQTENDGVMAVKGVQLAPADADDGAPGDKQNETSASKTIGCDHMIVSAGALIDEATATEEPTAERVFRSIRLIHGKPLAQQEQQRHIVIFPPGSFTGQTSVIHGFLLDEYSRVLPMLGTANRCTLVQLTMTANDPTVAASVFGLALDAIVNSSPQGSSTTSPCEELFSMTFSYAMSSAETQLSRSTPGLHAVERSRPGLTADAAFAQAERIFHSIRPNEKFLEVSETVGDAIREALGDTALDGEPDEEEQALESAVGLLQPTSEPTTAVDSI